MQDIKSPYIFDIQRFSIHDGSGIRTVLFTKGCPLKCSWCQNPESQKYNPQIAFYYEKCKNCNKCVEICPSNAIDIVSKISNYSACILCEACVDVCENDARRIIGKEMKKEDIFEELLKDIDFFENSGGGITFSGGEPFMHPEFLFETLKKLKDQNIHTNIETSGHFDFEKVKNLLPYINQIFFDIKHLDTNVHKKYTGVGNELILSNFEKLNTIFEHIQVRIPLIPGVNDSIEHIKSVCDFLVKKGHKSVHLLPYHSMGNSKAVRIDHKTEKFEAEAYSTEKIKMIKSQFSEFGIEALTIS